MKKRIILLCITIATIIAAMIAFAVTTSAEVYTGSCGTNVTYTLNTSTGVLEITGTGAMKNYSSSSAPWYSNRNYIKTVKIGDSVTSIGEGAFGGCSSLTSVEITDSVKRIGNSAFNGCSSLTSVVIGDSVTSIGNLAFYGCSSLTSVVIGDSVTSIGDKAFENCSNLTNLYISDLESWLNVSLSDHPLYSAGGNLYIDGVLATDIRIPDSVTSIGDYAFMGCSSLTSVEIPDSVTSIGWAAFCNCSSLTSVEIPDSVTSIGPLAFEDCSSLTSVEIPDSVTSIGAWAFYGCSSLTSVEIPDSVTSIDGAAFENCRSLRRVYLYKNSYVETHFKSNYSNVTRIYLDVSGIKFDFTETALHIGETKTITATIFPEYALKKSVTWSSSDDSIVSVDQDGNITRLASGIATITATTVDGGFTASFDVYDYSVTFDLDGGVGDFADQGKEIDVPITIHSGIPEKEGYDFGGWKDPYGNVYAPGASLNTNADFALKAIWTPKIYNVIYNANGGSNAPDDTIKEHFEDYRVSPEIPVKTGYNFTGWECSDGKIYQPGDVCSVNDHITFTAVWEEKTYDVIYDANGGVGSPSNAKKYYFSNYTISSATPLMEGYDFKEWSGSDGNTYNPGDVYSKNTNLTLSAVWTVKKFEITYDANGGDDGPENSYKEYFSDYVISLEIPVKTGYNFAGWECSDGKIYQPGDVCSVNDHITFTAIWTEKTYDVIYDANGGVGSPSNAKKYYFSNYIISSATPLMEGYDFKEWSGSDGNTYNPGDVYSKNTNLTLSAVWTVKKFEITYDANGGDGGPESSYKEYFSDYVISPTIPSKEGNSFRYWRGSDGKTYYPGDTYSKNQALSLTAVWKLYSYEIIFDVNGGNEFFADEIKYFDVDFVIFSDIPTKEGYKFIGWQGSDGNTYNGGDVYTGNSDLTLTAIWELRVYSITYDANGGSNAPENGTKEHFLDFTISNTTPTLTGYDFVGWRGSDGKTYYPNDTYSTNANVVLTAIWQLKTFTLFYDANGGSVSSASKSVQYSKRIGTLETPKKTGYAFDGWYTEKIGGTKVTSESIVEGLDDFTVYAHWTAITYSVTFNANGGAVSVPGSTVTFDSAYGTLPTPTYKGYKFEGWYTEKNGGELVTTETIVKIASAHTLYAHWKANVYLVSFDANGGECTPANAYVAYNSAYETLPVPTRNGYTFICWSKSKTEMDIVTKDTIHTLAEDIVLFAIWDANVYTLSFDALGGKIDIDYKTVTYGSPYGLLPISLYPNYIFGGWFLEKEYANKITSETIVSTAEDHTVYAMWIPLNYTIIYNANGGEGAPEQQTKEYGTDATLSDVEPTRKGFHFKGWSTTADGAVVYSPGAVYSENADLTLYAVWEAINYGDPNGDNTINAVDAVLIAQKLAGWDVELDISAADCNGDGVVNAVDAVLLAQYLAGWDVVLG